MKDSSISLPFTPEEVEFLQKKEPSPAENYTVPTEPKLTPIDRKQMLLRAVEIEKLIPEDHEARAIWEFVGRLDLSCYYDDIRSRENGAGRPALDPHLLISLWIYGYSQGVSSAREIARLCEFHPAYQWLTGMTAINHHTFSDFRSEHKESLDKLFVEVLGLLTAEGLITMERIMQDGTKIKAFAKKDSFKKEDRLKECLQAAKEQIEILDTPKEQEELSIRQEKARQRAAREKKEKLEKALLELEELRKIKKTEEEKAKTRISTTDPEARIMKQSDGGFAPSYNVQISTDAANDLIVGIALSQAGNDTHELIPAVERMKETLGETPKQIVVDSGYTTKDNIIEMSQRSIDMIGSIPSVPNVENLKKPDESPTLKIEAFTYNSADDTFTCPGKQIMQKKETRKEFGGFEYRYFTEKGTCQNCPYQPKCCPQNSITGRGVSRKVDGPEIKTFKEKMNTEEAKAIYKQRSPIAEFPNAWIKEKMGIRQFRLQGLIKAGMESLWACIAYNVSRWMGLKWRCRWA